MNEWQIKIKSSAKNDLRKVMQSNLRTRFMEIKQTLENDPYEPIQSFEKLEPTGRDYYSRRLNGKHRVVYKINKQDKIVEILSCWSHYE
ncbi:Txe/YoeB family addiction module toxin [Lactobacillus sp. ESL0703]|uniref:Txe/YoeB family addiction module toxin n=1 Tax=Lactobacillus sp. ESL0703 TaxID=2983218 RepID=UPI0023F8B1D8|nr:Txe/YoeB family addiction module toxin [Lactobacillus sp. ESL0703]MDF7668514.1 Txe/YoeB family addiction module toxin [Lactobacillus sp. ESL0703]